MSIDISMNLSILGVKKIILCSCTTLQHKILDIS